MKNCILLFLFITTTAWAQSNLKGEIKDHHNEAAVGANVLLIALPDSQQVAGVATNAQGKFEFTSLKRGNYFVKISYLGSKKYQSPTIRLSATSLVLPTIFLLSEKAKQLAEVVVKTTRPLVVQEEDKTVINVEAMNGAATLSAQEVLERTPSLVVDQNGNVQLNGRSNVLVLIDGRPTYMSGTDLVAYLKSLPAQMLDKLELMDSPPAKYDAAGSAIVNIVLKKNRLYGLTGNISTSQSVGHTWRSYNNLNLNYRQGKLNLFGGVGLPRDANRTVTISTRTITENTTNQEYTSNNTATSESLGGTIRLGFDYDKSKNTVIGGQLFLQKSQRNDGAVFSNLINNEPYYGTNRGQFDWNNLSANLNFTHKPQKQGSEWSGDVNYQQYGSNGVRNFQSSHANNTQIFNNVFFTPATILTFKTDYRRPVSKTTIIEMGAKIGFVKNANEADVENKKDQNFVLDPTKSNHFFYNENINAAYLNLRHTLNKRTSLQMGLRAENTNIEGNLLPNIATTGEQFSQHFTNLFPTFFFRRALDSVGKHSLSFNYGRRINRPSYQQFNPFLNYVDDYTFTSGNPSLKPFYLHNLQLRYQHNNGISVGLAMDFADGLNSDLNIREGDVFVRKPFNLGKGYRFGIVSNYNKKINKYWTTNVSFQGFRFNIQGTVNGDVAVTRYVSFRINAGQQFSFGKGWSADLYANISARDQVFTMTMGSFYSIYVGVGKKILKDKGSIRLMIDDPTFANYRTETMTNYQNTTQYRKTQSDTRRIGLNFSYRFGNEKYTRRRQTEDAAEEERRRVQ
ncbi:TonB-dependent receptor [Runella sp. MFBS21]|uniref:TonB-dependent receptor domain-containing protein n=1 Tax=Runella sp. MFBS21 TaxID=3034018 RepID=UPI0023F7EEA3|nr:TonB-dependent receptor [Runella sp. MFBS21]MDF7819316.1 TonB-dependent receptor [Runella sp. MFBS21]